MRKLLIFIFLALFGLGIGLAIGAILMRRVDKAAAQVRPDNLAAAVGRRAAEWRARLSIAMDAGSRAAAEKEAELRGEYGVPTMEEVARQHRPRH